MNLSEYMKIDIECMNAIKTVIIYYHCTDNSVIIRMINQKPVGDFHLISVLTLFLFLFHPRKTYLHFWATEKFKKQKLEKFELKIKEKQRTKYQHENGVKDG